MTGRYFLFFQLFQPFFYRNSEGKCGIKTEKRKLDDIGTVYDSVIKYQDSHSNSTDEKDNKLFAFKQLPSGGIALTEKCTITPGQPIPWVCPTLGVFIKDYSGINFKGTNFYSCIGGGWKGDVYSGSEPIIDNNGLAYALGGCFEEKNYRHMFNYGCFDINNPMSIYSLCYTAETSSRKIKVNGTFLPDGSGLFIGDSGKGKLYYIPTNHIRKPSFCKGLCSAQSYSLQNTASQNATLCVDGQKVYTFIDGKSQPVLSDLPKTEVNNAFPVLNFDSKGLLYPVKDGNQVKINGKVLPFASPDEAIVPSAKFIVSNDLKTAIYAYIYETPNGQYAINISYIRKNQGRAI